jgi:hypothetical protein
MNIKPTTPQRNRAADSQHLESNRVAESQKPDPGRTGSPEAEKSARVDSVDVSSEAKALASESRVSESSLSAERLKEIGERLASGYYDRREVIEHVARRVAGEAEFRAGE